MNGAFNVSKGSAQQLIEEHPGSITILLLRGVESDNTLADHRTVASLLNDVNNTEASFTNYQRLTGQAGDYDINDSRDLVYLDVETPVFPNAGGPVNNTIIKVIVAVQTGDDDTTLIPLTFHDLGFTTDGSNLALTVGDSGFMQSEDAIVHVPTLREVRQATTTVSGGSVFLESVEGLTAWRNMVQSSTADALAQDWVNGRSVICEYDPNHVFRWLQERLGSNTQWQDAKEAWESQYDTYIDSNDGEIVNRCMYPQGLYWDYDQDDKTAVLDRFELICDNAWMAYEDHDTVSDQWHVVRGREGAHALHTHLLYEEAAGDRSSMQLHDNGGYTASSAGDRYRLLLEKLEYMLWQWRNQDWSNTSAGSEDWDVVRPWVAGLVGHALARYHEMHQSDEWTGNYWSTLGEALITVFTYLRETAVDRDGGSPLWRSDFDGNGNGCWVYQDLSTPDGNGPSFIPEMNNLISPVYQYLGVLTGESKYTNYADEMFAGAAKGFTLQSSHHNAFCQINNYLRDFFRWREGRLDIGPAPSVSEYEELVNSSAFSSICQSWIDGFEYNTSYDWTHGLRWLQEHFGARQFWEDARVAWRQQWEDDLWNEGMIAHGVYPQGLYEDYVKDGRQMSLDSLRLLVEDKAWAGWQHEEQNSHFYWNSGSLRLTGYAMEANFFLEQAVGRSNMNLKNDPTDPDDRFNLLLRKLESMSYQNRFLDWSDVPDITDSDGNVANVVKPFMVGIGTHALARYHEKHGSDNWGGYYFNSLEVALVELLRWMREEAVVRDGSHEGHPLWQPNAAGSGWGAFHYQDLVGDHGTGEQTWVLNNLICPPYAYAALITGERKYMDYADEIWRGAVQDAHPNYRWTGARKEMGQLNHYIEDYFRWRNEWKSRYG